MDTKSIIGLVIVCAVAAVFLWKHFVKPAGIDHDATLCFTGGLGSSKSLNSVKQGIKSIKRALSSWSWGCLKVRVVNWFIKTFKKDRPLLVEPERPEIFSITPLRFLWHFHWVYSKVLTREMLTLRERIPVGSVIFIDEFPQFCNQFDWENASVRNELNEFITFFRHYVNGVLIINAQSLDEVESHVRRKLNSYYYCFDFAKFLCFYRVRILRCRVGDVSVSLTSDFIDQNAKWHYGLLLPWFRNYDSRCYRHRYDKVPNLGPFKTWNQLTTNRIVRMDLNKVSPLDDKEGEASNDGFSDDSY